MRKETYETPYMDRVQVVMENGIMQGSLGEKASDSSVDIIEQTPGVAIGGGTKEDGWDDNPWGNGWDK